MAASCEATVLGAGIVGISIALQLQLRGINVAVVDRNQSGLATSFGNGGLIQKEAVLPYTFPQRISTILSYSMNQRRDSHYHAKDILNQIPILFKYWKNGRSDKIIKTALANVPLYEKCLTEHRYLASLAGADDMFRPDGWIRVFRNAKTQDAMLAENEVSKRYGVKGSYISNKDIQKLEPHLNNDLLGGIHYKEPYSLKDPLALTKAYEALFLARGGQFFIGDARSLEYSKNNKWSVTTETGGVTSKHIVVALGPWSDEIVYRFGYKIPMFVKRGYHMHYEAVGNAVLNHPVYDVDGGYMLTSTDNGIRLVTGAQFCRRDAPPSPIQLKRVEPWARTLFPIGVRKATNPWMGCRPCLPDMLPVIGPAPAHPGLWFAFGHGHHGLTLAAVTGRLMADLIGGTLPFTDPSPYRVERF